VSVIALRARKVWEREGGRNTQQSISCMEEETCAETPSAPTLRAQKKDIPILHTQVENPRKDCSGDNNYKKDEKWKQIKGL